MWKTWLRYFLYFLCPLFVVSAIWVLLAIRSDGVFTVAERGAALLLGGVCLLLAVGLSLYVTHAYARRQRKTYLVTSEQQRKRLIEALQKLLTEEIPATAKREPAGTTIFDGTFTFFWGMQEPVRIVVKREGLYVEAPKKLMTIIDLTADEVLLHSV